MGKLNKVLFFLSTSTILCILGGVFFFKDHVDQQIKISEKNKTDWTTYTKKQNKIVKYPSTQKELKKLGASSIPKKNKEKANGKDKKAKRNPANLAKKDPSSFLKGRKVIGEKNYDRDQLDFINKVNPSWKEKLSENLLLHRERKAKLLILPEKSLIKIKNNKAQYLELVSISFLFKGDDRNSFHAFVDSETGAILETWNRSIHDKVGSRPLKLTPNGTL